VSRLMDIVQASGIEAVLNKDGEADWLLLVNGCQRACLEEELSQGVRPRRYVSVEGCHLDYQPVAEDKLPEAVWEAIREVGRAVPLIGATDVRSSSVPGRSSCTAWTLPGNRSTPNRDK
jgi:hypothetical protein